MKGIFRYSSYGLEIHSEVELPGLPAGDGEPDVVIRLGSVPRTPQPTTMEEQIAIHGRGGAFHIRNGREIVIEPLPGANPELLWVLLIGRMMAYLLRQRGWLPLHSSGVTIEGKAVLFLGQSGSGKSTTAAAFHAHECQAITDDVAAVRVMPKGECLLRPAGPRIRLLDDSRAVWSGREPGKVFKWDKFTFDVARGKLLDLYPVRRIYVLEYGQETGSCAIDPMRAVALLSRHSFVLQRNMNREALKAHLRDCTRVADAVPVRKLIRPRSLDALPGLVRFVEADLAAG